MTLDEARAEIEEKFPPHPEIGNYYQAATGEPYVVMTNCGPKREGDIVHAHVSEEFAVDGWFNAMKEYAADKRSFQLYWRVPPEIERDKNGGWRIYSRLLISDMPQIQPQVMPPRAA